jgi:hypothetical protein
MRYQNGWCMDTLRASFNMFLRSASLVQEAFFPWLKQNCVVGIATFYGMDGPGIESWCGVRCSTPIQTDPGANPASCTMGTGSFSVVKPMGHGVDHPPLSSAEVKERVKLYLYSLSGPLWTTLLKCWVVRTSELLDIRLKEFCCTVLCDNEAPKSILFSALWSPPVAQYCWLLQRDVAVFSCYKSFFLHNFLFSNHVEASFIILWNA